MILPMGGGGAKQLAVKVQLGATQPTGSAGMLWVETTAASNKWTAAVAEPGSPASGDIWVQTDGANAHVIEMLRKNSIRINVLRVRQYDGTAWISRNAHYHDGTGWTQVSSAFNPATDVSYTGTMSLIDDGSGHWRIKLLTSGILTFAVEPPGGIDAFLVGGGGAGGIWDGSVGAGGGGAGYTTTARNILPIVNTSYPIVVGAGGNQTGGGSTTAFGNAAPGGSMAPGQSASGGNGGSGGGSYVSPGGSDGNNGSNGGGAPGIGQGSTTREFGDASGVLYAGGGGGGHLYSSDPQAAGGDGGGGSTWHNGTANTGGGGGGGCWQTNPGTGGSGIVVIRDHRAA